MRFAHSTTLDLPISTIDLPEWLFNMTEADYASCARGHRGVGVIGDRAGMINVESIGGSLLVQHYETQVAEKHHVTMVSPASRAYMMHLVPVRCSVVWDMRMSEAGPATSLLECKIDVTLPTVIHILSYTSAAPFFIRRHLVEETHGFARSIVHRFGPE